MVSKEYIFLTASLNSRVKRRLLSPPAPPLYLPVSLTSGLGVFCFFSVSTAIGLRTFRISSCTAALGHFRAPPHSSVAVKRTILNSHHQQPLRPSGVHSPARRGWGGPPAATWP
ncbi:unnamed protein product [Tetraodon nigroviridis]|uniref:(spotted green pufferfish) hypothetical protein n=1 Tax=Tetraodon nigroviridis TaxID=99883 RepID=Q4S9L3_TETNG|nr:unnamed protein product [Tetraodon nigroviridis]